MTVDRVLQLLAAVLLLLLGVGYIEHRRQDQEARRLAAMGDRVAAFAVADRSVRREMLSTRIRLVRHYDDLNRATTAAEQAASELAAMASANPDLSRRADGLRQRLALRHETLERYKSENALLQNALARFADLSDGQGAARFPLSGEIMQLTLDPRPDAVEQARRQLANHALDEAGALAAQARVLVAVLPTVDDALRRTQADGLDAGIGEIGSLLDRYGVALAERRLMQGLQSGLVLAALIASLSALIWRALERGRRARRQVEAEHLSATVAATLLSPEDSGEPRVVSRALAEIGRYADASRVLLACDGRDGTRNYAWPTDDGDARPFAAAVKRLHHAGAAKELTSGQAVEDIGGGLTVYRDSAWPRLTLGIQDGRRKDAAEGICLAVGVLARAAHRDEVAAERMALERRMARTERLQAVGTIASGVAHNFNNIIAAIAGFAEMAGSRVRANSATANHLAEIRYSVQRARTLVDDVLGLAGRDAGEAQRVSVSALVEETEALLRASHADGSLLVVDVEDGLEVMGSAARLQQVLMNICNNARHAGGDDSRVLLRVSSREIVDRLALSHGKVEPGRWCVIGVTDEGPGIQAAVLPRLFEPFFTTRPGGTGLGLSTAWQIVADHGGSIDVTTPETGGSTFAIWLPQVTSEPTGSGERILLLTDLARAEQDEEMLARLGYEPCYLTDDTDGPTAAEALLAVEPSSSNRGLIESCARRKLGVIIAVGPSSRAAWRGLADAFVTVPLDADEVTEALTGVLRANRARRLTA